MIQTFVCASGVENTILATSWDASGWERLDSTFKRLGTVGFHFQAVGNGWFPFPSGWERLVSTFKRLGTVGFHFQAVGNG